MGKLLSSSSNRKLLNRIQAALSKEPHQFNKQRTTTLNNNITLWHWQRQRSSNSRMRHNNMFSKA